MVEPVLAVVPDDQIGCLKMFWLWLEAFLLDLGEDFDLKLGVRFGLVDVNFGDEGIVLLSGLILRVKNLNIPVLTVSPLTIYR